MPKKIRKFPKNFPEISSRFRAHQSERWHGKKPFPNCWLAIAAELCLGPWLRPKPWVRIPWRALFRKAFRAKNSLAIAAELLLGSWLRPRSAAPCRPQRSPAQPARSAGESPAHRENRASAFHSVRRRSQQGQPARAPHPGRIGCRQSTFDGARRRSRQGQPMWTPHPGRIRKHASLATLATDAVEKPKRAKPRTPGESSGAATEPAQRARTSAIGLVCGAGGEKWRDRAAHRGNTHLPAGKLHTSTESVYVPLFVPRKLHTSTGIYLVHHIRAAKAAQSFAQEARGCVAELAHGTPKYRRFCRGVEFLSGQMSAKAGLVAVSVEVWSF